jgi:hypothetical protein
MTLVGGSGSLLGSSSRSLPLDSVSAPESSVFGGWINGSASSQRAALVFGDAYPGARKGSIAII